MEYRLLGNTGLKVSRLCFGGLTIGPLQAKLPLRQGADIIRSALAAGVNFIDTAELYGTYPYIKDAIADFPDVMVASKSYAYTYEDMRRSVEDACRSIGRDYIDVYMLHEQVSRHTIRGHGDALNFLLDAKKQGLVRAVGISTHTVEVVRAAGQMEQFDLIHPILNMRGIGIIDGGVGEMLTAIKSAVAAGKGVYTMKALGGGHLILDAAAAFDWIRKWDEISSVAVGMQSEQEVAVNCRLFSGKQVAPDLWRQVKGKQRRLLVEDWCEGCGACAAKCPMDAISMIDGKAVVKPEKCVLCGYCGAHCPEFCLKII